MRRYRLDKLKIFAWTSYEYVPNETDKIERYIGGIRDRLESMIKIR